jgi:HAD superfamily hydrolase (TIGR01549 family)
MKQFDVILFDLGNTLIYFDAPWTEVLPQINRALNTALVRLGIPVAETDFYANFDARMQAYYAQRETEFIEYTTAYVLRDLLNEMGFSNLSEAALRQAIAEMYAVSQAHWQVEADALTTLEALQQAGYRLGIISNASDDQDVQTLVDKAGVREYFEVILTSAAEGIRKPNPRIFHTALERMGSVTAPRAAMVGDTLGADILGARNAGLYSIWITRRADTPANRDHLDTIQPDAQVQTLAELAALLA